MTFLNPAVLFGLLAASLPVLIHLLNLRKLKKIEFSTLRFLKELQKNKIRKLKLKQWLLLALRVLTILLIVTAFARPTLEGVSILGTTSAAKTTALFILDDTFSMSVVKQNGSYFNQAKQKIKELLNQLQEGDEAGLILVSSPEDEINLTTNIAEFRQKLDGINISYITGNINSAVIKAAQVMEDVNNFNKEVYLLTDFQEGRLAEENTLPDLSEVLNEQVRLYSIDFSDEENFNIGIDDLNVNTQIFEKDKPVEFETVVTNYSGKPVDNLVVSLFMNGDRTAQQSINLPANKTETVKLEGNLKSTGYVDAFVEIEDDDILQDNKRYTSIYVPEKIQVLLVSDNQNDYRFVNLALQPAGNDNYFEVTIKKADQLPAVQLNNFDVVIIIGNNFANSSNQLKQFVEDGKGLLIFPGSEAVGNDFSSSLNSFGLPSANGLIKKEANDQSVKFDEIDFRHPVFKNIFIDESKRQVESPALISYYKMNPSSVGKNIIRLIDGSSFLSEYKKGNGKIFVFNSSPVLSWSDFPLKSIFVPLINKSVIYLASVRSSNEKYFTGETINVNVGGRTLPQIKVKKPESNEEIINLDETKSSPFLNFPSTETAGNYKFLSGENILADINVNTDPKESVVEYLNENDFDNYLKEIKFNGNHITIGKDVNAAQLVMQARFGSELWKYFLIAAIIIALIEMTVARNVKKEIVEVSS